MTNPDPESGATRDDLLQRIELMECMIAEGRQSTMRCGWIFVLWGLVDLTAWSWQHFLPNSHFAGPWAWPICLVAGAILTVAGVALQKGRVTAYGSMQCRNIGVLWSMMGVALAIYVAGAMARHLTWQYSYIAALLIIVGLSIFFYQNTLRVIRADFDKPGRAVVADQARPLPNGWDSSAKTNRRPIAPESACRCRRRYRA